LVSQVRGARYRKGRWRLLGIARSDYYYWNKRWREAGKTLVSLYDKPRTPHSSPRELEEDAVSLVIAVRLETGYGKLALARVLARDYDCIVSDKAVNNTLRRAGLLSKPKPRKARRRQLDAYEYAPGERGQLDVKPWKRVAYQYDIIEKTRAPSGL
jgi:transposase